MCTKNLSRKKHAFNLLKDEGNTGRFSVAFSQTHTNLHFFAHARTGLKNKLHNVFSSLYRMFCYMTVCILRKHRILSISEALA